MFVRLICDQTWPWPVNPAHTVRYGQPRHKLHLNWDSWELRWQWRDLWRFWRRLTNGNVHLRKPTIISNLKHNDINLNHLQRHLIKICKVCAIGRYRSISVFLFLGAISSNYISVFKLKVQARQKNRYLKIINLF